MLRYGMRAGCRLAIGVLLGVLPGACGSNEPREEPVPQRTRPVDAGARDDRDEASARLDRALAGEPLTASAANRPDGGPVTTDPSEAPSVAAPPAAMRVETAGEAAAQRVGDVVVIEGEAVAPTRQQAVDAARARAQAEAAQRRVSRIHAESVDILSDQGDDAFRQVTNLVTNATLAGVEPETLSAVRGADGWTARVRVRVPREQIEPARWMAEARARPDAAAALRGAVERARLRGDVEAEALGLRHLRDLDGTRASLEVLVGRLLELGLYQAADTELLAWASSHADDAAYVEQRRQEVAASMKPAADRIRDLLAAVERRPRRGLELDVALRRAGARDVQTVSGRVAPGGWLALVFVDAESLGLWEVLAPDALARNARAAGAASDAASLNFAVDFDFRSAPEAFVPGAVQLLAIRVDDPTRLPYVPRPIDLGACARGDLAEMQRLVAAEASLREAALAEANAACVLRWTQVDR